jgi:hypothetical protein
LLEGHASGTLCGDHVEDLGDFLFELGQGDTHFLVSEGCVRAGVEDLGLLDGDFVKVAEKEDIELRTAYML